MSTLLAFFGLGTRCKSKHAGLIAGRDRKGRPGVICFECHKLMSRTGRWILCMEPLAPSILDRREL